MRRLALLTVFLCSPIAHAFDQDKELRIESDDGRFLIQPAMRVQVRGAVAATNSGAPQHAITIPRARLLLHGHAWSENVGYRFQADWNEEGSTLMDYFINYRIGAGVQVRAGQYKKPFTRHFLQPNNTVALVEYSFINAHYGSGRDIGLMFHNGIAEKTGFEWSAALFDGHGMAGVPAGEDRRIHPLIVARIGLSTPGMREYSQIDFERGGLRAALAFNTQLDFDADQNDDGQTRHGLDGMVKLGGFGGQFAVYTQTLQTEPDRWSAQRIIDYGLHTEANFVVEERLAPALRYAMVRARDRDTGTDIDELRGGFTTYFHRHKLKWAHDIGITTHTILGRRPITENSLIVRSQVELMF